MDCLCYATNMLFQSQLKLSPSRGTLQWRQISENFFASMGVE